ncbi:MAG: O-acetyl-ADP-ribose deacetylase [Kofleriaceae bacterium]|nr:O-acetyl-ADP-ribose deacetylase [Kofleriaceae bacterium]MBP9170441.1 O-acetyl-ADP-ribose deacetylase [Kofleriaceae bacterium]MBP9860697.1 O-acetyl-ADP-ribose deacetylase [Kofleriaceae bacterium]
MSRIEIWQGDITTLAVDAIVNAANTSLLGGGGVDGAIHRAAGRELVEACRPLGGCKVGDAKLTPGFGLPARHVIHTVGPRWRGGGANEPEQLASCYRRAIALAREHGFATIAFPAISTGVYGYPPALAAMAACRTVAAELATHELPRRVILVAFDDATAGHLRTALAAYPA